MSKPAKPAAAAAAGDQPPKSKKMLIIIIAVVVLLAGGGAAAFFMMKKDHPPKAEHAAASEDAGDAADSEDEADAAHKLPPKFVDIGTFTANLMKEDTDSVIQVAITLKLSKPELEEKVKESTPEIQHVVNMMLQSKYRSQLATVAGKEKLASDIKMQVEFILGLRKSAPEIHAVPPVQEGEAAPAEGDAHHAEAAEKPSKKGVAEVLFTSFIIQ